MYRDKKIIVVLPAFNAEQTLQKTYNEIPTNVVDEVILCDDASTDGTVSLASDIGIDYIIQHKENKGYGGNQKSLYNAALERGADIVIMLHPDYQYTPSLIPVMAAILSDNPFDTVLASRILGNGALKGGMPVYKYIANRFLTFTQNLFVNHKLSEYHTGYRAFRREVLESINFNENSDDFVFDNEMLSQIIYQNYAIAEVTCPTKYFEEASSINLSRSITYGIGVLRVSMTHFLCKMGLMKSGLYKNLQPKKKKKKNSEISSTNL